MLTEPDYSRQEGAVDLAVMQQSKIGIVGIGSFSQTALNFVRMGVGQFWACDPDSVEPRNVTSQGFTWHDAQQRRPKVDAFRDECLAINPDVRVETLAADFVTLPDARLKALLKDTSLLLMTTDHHPAQARGALAALVCDRPVILASIYRLGRAGEIIFQYPGQTFACYRCITRERYEHVARQQAPATGTANGSLPFAAQMVDANVGHLAVGILHKWHGATENRFAQWIDRLGDRNFVQIRMDPDYRLGDDDLFGRVFGHDEQTFCFDTIWQPGSAELNPHCPDCHGRGATVAGRWREETTEMERLACGCLAQRGRGCDGDCGHMWGCGH
ncbi:MAG: ThiF family adenylyltransferase [Planctomycetota bacterium]|nr:ThiF family adenylyltransferase [Planctomycetota bacterium]